MPSNLLLIGRFDGGPVETFWYTDEYVYNCSFVNGRFLVGCEWMLLNIYLGDRSLRFMVG